MRLLLTTLVNVACLLQPFAYALLLPQGCPWQVWAIWTVYVLFLVGGFCYFHLVLPVLPARRHPPF
jgi:hypothetical protein